MLSPLPQYNGVAMVEGESFLSRKLFLLAMVVSSCLILLPALLVRGCDWGLTPSLPNASELVPAIPIVVYIEEELVTMDLEDYIKGVVKAEMPVSFHLEALKAQAVAARTYAVLRMRAFGGSGCEHHPGADITADAQRAQAFASGAPADWGRQTYHYSALVEQAVRETDGLIVTYDDYPIDAVYHSTCGGHTEAAGDVWQQAVPYLLSVECGHCSHSRYYRTNYTLTWEEAARLLQVAGASPGSEIFRIDKTSASGRAHTISTERETWRGLDFRTRLGLPSTHFNHEVCPDVILFQCQGWGHGVGMCQYGADGLARSGRSFLDILSHYYPGTRVRPIFHE